MRLLQDLGRFAALMHLKYVAFRLAPAHLLRVAVTGCVAGRAVTRLLLEIGRAVAAAPIGDPEEEHVLQGATEFKADLQRNFLTVFHGHMVSVIDDRHIGRLTNLVRKLAIAKFVSTLEHLVQNAGCVGKAVLVRLLESVNRIWVNANAGDFMTLLKSGDLFLFAMTCRKQATARPLIVYIVQA
jgi:hypothetical protein